ncbi:MAG: hypothetical protein Q8M01_10090 [Rubrivivax sp.]|nr:hypothetical protein [Rubrivivax sp.]
MSTDTPDGPEVLRLVARCEAPFEDLHLNAVTAVSHPDSIYAGAIGAALWGAFRHGKLRQLETAATV